MKEESEPPDSYLIDFLLIPNFPEYFERVNKSIRNSALLLNSPFRGEHYSNYKKEVEHWWRVLDRHESYIDNLLESQVKGSKISDYEREIVIKNVPKLAEIRRKTTKMLRCLEERYGELEGLEELDSIEDPLFVSFGFGHS